MYFRKRTMYDEDELLRAAAALPACSELCSRQLAVLRMALPVAYRRQRHKDANDGDWRSIPRVLLHAARAYHSLFVLSLYLPLMSERKRQYHINRLIAFATA